MFSLPDLTYNFDSLEPVIDAKTDIPAVAIWAGAGYTYQDLQDLGLNDNSYRPPTSDTRRTEERRKLREYYGEFDPNSWFWKQVIPTNYLNDISGSIALFQSEDDTVVNPEYNKNLNKILDSTNITHELHLYPSGGHNIEGPSFIQAMRTTVGFYNIYLKN